MFTIDKTDLIPVGHRIIIEVESLEEKVGNFYVAPDPTDRRREEIAREVGTILAMGPSAFDGRSIIDDTVQIGDKVMFKRYAGAHFEVGERDVRILNDDDIMAKVKVKDNG